jgi:hypothetical protein
MAADARALQRAWILLVVALALHVVDEALTDFLAFYNPLVLQIRSRVAWFPMPTFAFTPWIAMLAVALVLLAALTPAVRRGMAGARVIAYGFSGIMFLNGVGHLAGSVYFGRWLPGATSAPLLLAASSLLFYQLRRRTPSRGPHASTYAGAPDLS